MISSDLSRTAALGLADTPGGTRVPQEATRVTQGCGAPSSESTLSQCFSTVPEGADLLGRLSVRGSKWVPDHTCGY